LLTDDKKCQQVATHRITDTNHFFLNPTDTIINRRCQTSRGTFWKVRIVFLFLLHLFLN